MLHYSPLSENDWIPLGTRSNGLREYHTNQASVDGLKWNWTALTIVIYDSEPELTTANNVTSFFLKKNG